MFSSYPPETESTSSKFDYMCRLHSILIEWNEKILTRHDFGWESRFLRRSFTENKTAHSAGDKIS